jgi:hypothetical protein
MLLRLYDEISVMLRHIYRERERERERRKLVYYIENFQYLFSSAQV